MSQLIKVEVKTIGNDEVNAINARELHSFLGVETRFNDWIKRRIEEFDFINDIDYLKKSNSDYQGIGKPNVEYIISLEMAMVLAITERLPKGAEAYKFFCSFLGKEVIIKHKKRLEFQFGEVVANMFSAFKIITQYPVFGGKYYIDWYIPELKLAIEFDEPHHWGNTKDDDKRQLEIEKELGCRFARYKM